MCFTYIWTYGNSFTILIFSHSQKVLHSKLEKFNIMKRKLSITFFPVNKQQSKLTPLAPFVPEVCAAGEEFDDAPSAPDLSAFATVAAIVSDTAASVPVTVTVTVNAIAIDLESVLGRTVPSEGTAIAVAESPTAPAIPHLPTTLDRRS